MPLLSTLERFIARVEHNKHVEAIEEFFYDPKQFVAKPATA